MPMGELSLQVHLKCKAILIYAPTSYLLKLIEYNKIELLESGECILR